ncbi:MAG: AAA family ATPase [Bradyrhizobium sp.]|uniref:ATP-binding protein n=1 Tax=Bradyrhizobium sp. TaxID=376 RepID=UPI001C2A2917|nr:adenylate/guanylate cyclase domain-containing protein [Bradyrhizobium sp.]MBU6464433.1 AAA family ATPase [Pseudomonadota bacterium]MDE2069105.1 AAA family ATPase [Bradyrhizobium sp.]
MKATPLSEWLKLHQLERFLDTFEKNEVDLATLRMLTESDLQELGLPFGPRKRIRNLLRGEKSTEKAGISHQSDTSTSERRHLTVLFCDMVGFTKLSYKLDPEAMQIVLRSYEEACETCVNRYEGYVFRVLGDGVVAFFGFPLAHEAESERAVRAGLDIVDTLAHLHLPGVGRLQVRIGITSGMAVVASGERNAVGETINLAARLQTIAKPGSIIVSESVRRMAGGGFEYDDLGEKELKGVSGPTRIYRVLGVSRAESRFEAATQRDLTPIVGRGAEISALLDDWRQVQETGVGRAILLRGESGIGKSRMASALRERIQDEGRQTLVFQCSPFFINSAFYPIRASFERALQPCHDGSAEARLNKLEALAIDRLGLARDDMRLVAALLSIPHEQRYGSILLSPKLAKEETMRVLIEFVRAHARLRPTLLLFEDAHWADPTSLDLLMRFIELLPGIPALLVITARPEFNSPLASLPAISVMDLAKFTPRQSETLVANVVGGKALPPGLAAQIIDRADGVPLFVEELTKTILESGDLVVDGDHYAYAGSSAGIRIPETLRDSLMARLDRVAVSKEIAQVGSVIGREFSYELSAGLELMSEDVLTNGLQHLTASGLATCQGEIPHSVYTFSHALVQDAAYDSLLKSRRKQLHGDIAHLLEERWPDTRDKAPELLAFHYNSAEQYRVAVPLWLRAGEVAMQRFALPEAISHLRTGMSALAKLRPSKVRDRMEISLRTALGPALVAHRGWAHAEVGQTLVPAWRLTQALKHSAAYLPILNTLSVHYMSAGRLTESLRWAGRLSKSGSELGDDGLEIFGHRAASACHYWLGDFAKALRSGGYVRKLYDPERHWGLVALTNTDPFTGEGIYRGQLLWMTGYPEQALTANQAMEANARRRGHPFDLAFALTLGAQLFGYLGDSDTLERCAQEAERIGQERGIALLGEILAEISGGVAWLHAGRLAEAVSRLDRSIEQLMQTGHRIWIWYLKTLQAEGLALMGDHARAWSLIEESVAQIEAGEERSHYAEMLRLKGWIQILRGYPDEAITTLRKAMAVARKQAAKSWELRAATTLARLLTSRGKKTEALALLAPIYDWFTEGHDTRDLREAAQLLAEMRGSPGRRSRTAGESKS